MSKEEYILEDALRGVAKDIAERISRRTIKGLQKITITLSGDDSVLKNTWDEICVQVRDEESFFWEAYDETVRSFVSEYVDELKPHEKLALWLQTNEGWDWIFEDEEEKEKNPPVFGEDIVQYIVQEYVYYEAASWTNERIRTYMERQYLD